MSDTGCDFTPRPELVVGIPDETLTGTPLDDGDEDDGGVRQTPPHNDAGPRKLRPYQTDAVSAVHKAWGDGSQRVSVVLPTGTGKDLSADTLIPVPGGYATLDGIAVGDLVYDHTGFPVRVIGVLDKGVQPVWRVAFSDGASVLAGGGHLWEVHDSDDTASVLTTREIAEAGLLDHRGRPRFRIPVTEALRREWEPLRMGTGSPPLSLDEEHGEGANEDAPFRVAQHSRGIGNTLERAARGARSRPHTTATRSLSDKACEPAYLLGKGLVSGERVPDMVLGHWLLAPAEARAALLAGILDAGVVADDDSIQVVDSTLVPVVVEAATSLGALAHTAAASEPGESTVRVTALDGAVIPTRKAWVTKHGRLSREIVSITAEGSTRTKCLTVDNARGLFLCTKHHIVTHNSTVIAKVANEAVGRGERVLALAHREELIDQIAASVIAVNPAAEVGVVQGADRDQPDNPIVVASFQTLSRSPKKLAALGRRDVILADECHHISAPTYVRVLEDLGAMDAASGVKSCGFTATMHRDDGKALGEVWSEVVFERDFAWAVKNGFLVPPKGKTIAIEGLNQLNNVHIRAGDYVREELEEVMAASVDSTVDAIMTHCPKGSALIVFAVSIGHAQALAEKLTDAGVRAECITGKHTRDQRRPVYDAYHKGDVDALVTVAVLTEGADFPRCDTVVMARPTRSRVLLSQCIGRAVRLHTDPLTGKEKTHATVLDLTGVTRDMKMASLTDLWPQAEREFFSETGEKLEPPAEPAPVRVKERHGRIELEDVELLSPDVQAHIREVVWLSTDPAITGARSEILFLPNRDDPFSYVFIWPPVAQMDTSQVTLGRLDRSGRADLWSDATGTPVVGTLRQAMDAAERVVGRKSCISRNAGWRRPQVRPSESQLKTARAVGVADPETLSRGQVNDRLSTIFASRAFADMLRRVRR